VTPQRQDRTPRADTVQCGRVGWAHRCAPLLATYTPGQVAEVIATVLTDPQQLNLPFGSWTLDRLEVYLNAQKGIPIKRSRLDESLIIEGLRSRQQETWFGERVEPDFAKKRGILKRSTLRRPRVAS
jgi:hypothetical protein